MSAEVQGVQGAQAVERAVKILRTVATLQRSGATLARIGQATALSRSTAFRLLRCLTDEGLLSFEENNRAYSIGPLAYELGLAVSKQSNLLTRWRPYIKRLARDTGMTAYLVARSDTDVVCLEAVEAEAMLRAVPLVPGQRLPLGIGAGSLAILSSLSDAEVDAVIASNELKLRFYGDGRITPVILCKRVAQTRKNGFAFSQQSVAKGIAGIGAVVPKGDSLTQLAVSVSMVGAEVKADEQARLGRIVRDVIDAALQAERAGA
jgi:DNA-binding IclR family transcriptional regulator